MTGPESPLGLAAAAIDQVRSAQRQVGDLIGDVEDVAGRLRAATDIPWSGSAAQAWRTRLDETRRGATGGARDLTELHELLSVLLDRMR